MQQAPSSSRQIRYVSESSYLETTLASPTSSSSLGKGAFPSPPPPPINLCATINICRFLLPLTKLVVLAQPLDDTCTEVEREAFVTLQNVINSIENTRSEAINVFPLLEKLCRYMGVNFAEFQGKDVCLVWDLFVKLITTVIPPLREIFMGRQRLSVNEKAWENLVTRCVSAHFTSSLQSLEGFICSTLSQIDENYYEDFDQFAHVKSTEQMVKFNASIIARAPEILAFTIDSAHLPPTSRLFEVSGKASSKSKPPAQIKFPSSFNLSTRQDAKGSGGDDCTIPVIYELSAVIALDGANFENVQGFYRLNVGDSSSQWFKGTDGAYEPVDSNRAIERNFFNVNDSKKVHPRLLVYTKRDISSILDTLRQYVTKAGQLRMKGDAMFAAAQTPENYDEAKQLYEDAIKYDASLRPILEERLKSLDQIEKNQRAQSYENQADLILGKKKFKEASDLYKLAMRSALPNSSIYKRIKEKEEFMTRIISLEIANHLTEKGEECLRNGSLSQSRDHFEHALKMNPSYIHLQSIIGGIDKLITAQTSQQKITDAHQCMKVGRYKQANSLFLEALQLVPEKELSLKPVLDSLVVLMQGEDALIKQRSGLVALEDKKFAVAIELITEAIALLPKESITEHAFFLCDRAQVYYEMKDYQTSILDCQAALTLRPELAVAYLRLGSAQFEMELFDEALVSYEKAMRFDQSMSDQVRVKIRQVNTAKEIQQRKEREAERARIKEEEQRRIEEKRAREEKLRKEKAEKAAQEQLEKAERNLMKEEEKRMRTILQREDPLDPSVNKIKGKDATAKGKTLNKKDKVEKEREKAAEKERLKAEKERERERIRAEKEAKIREEQQAKEEAIRKQREFEAEVAKATAKLKEAERERELEREKARIERDKLIAEREKLRQEKKAAEQKKLKEEQEVAERLESEQQQLLLQQQQQPPQKVVKTAAQALMTTPSKGKQTAASVLQSQSVTKPAIVSPVKASSSNVTQSASGDADFPTLGGGYLSSSKKETLSVAQSSISATIATTPSSVSKKAITSATKWASLVSSKDSEEVNVPASTMPSIPAAPTQSNASSTVAAAPSVSANGPMSLSRATTTPVPSQSSTQPSVARRSASSGHKVGSEEFPAVKESTPEKGVKSIPPPAGSVDNNGAGSLLSAFDTTGVPPLSGLQATSLPFVPTSFTPLPAPPSATSTPAKISTATNSNNVSFLNNLVPSSTSTSMASSSLSFGFGMDSSTGAYASDSILGTLDSGTGSSFGGLFGNTASSAKDNFNLFGGSSAFSSMGNLGLGVGSDSLGPAFPLSGGDSMVFDFARLTEPGSAVNGLEGSRLMSLGIASSSSADLGGESLFSKLAGPSTGNKSPDIFGSSAAVDSLGLSNSLLSGLGNQHVDLGISGSLSDVGSLGLGADVGLGSGFGTGLGSLLGSGGLTPLRAESDQWGSLGNGLHGLDAALGLSASSGLGLLPRGISAPIIKDLRDLRKKLEDERITDFTLFPSMTLLNQVCGAQLYRWGWDGTEWVEFALSLSRLSEMEFRKSFDILEKSGCSVKIVTESNESLILLTRGATGDAANIFMKNAMDTLAQLLPNLVVGNNSAAANNSRWASGAPQSLAGSETNISLLSALTESPVNMNTIAGDASISVVDASPNVVPRRTPSNGTANTSTKSVSNANNKPAVTAAISSTSSTSSSTSNFNSQQTSQSQSHATSPVPLAGSSSGATSLSALPTATKPRPAPLKSGSGNGQVRRFVEIPADMIGLVIGANGKNIKDLMAESAAKVQFKTAKASEREGKPGILELHGSVDACERALQLVWNLLQTVQREYREITPQAAAKATR